MQSHLFNPVDFRLILPEVQLSLFGLGILLTDFLLEPRYKYWNAVMAMLGVDFSGYTLWQLRRPIADQGDIYGFSGSLLVDPFFLFFGFLLLAATALVFLLSVSYMRMGAVDMGEVLVLELCDNEGMCLM